ncbi:IgGFc-binding protein [Nannocystis sp. ILAH1]|uniref:IgGFc-binding protein n=1 Tax=Nannocystis sp. ILAH1 TaxID=2996789 RepID=UPI002271AD5D|nr:IgGFc-binding protein [Nannocystis sp. ILAH1]
MTSTTTTTDSTTAAETLSTSSTTTTTTTGPNMLCNPGAVQCLDNTNYQTCSDDGQAWDGPTPCGAKEVCEFGACKSLCAKAQDALSSVGCEYYAVDANNDPVESFDSQPYAVVVSNVDPDFTADVQVQVHNGNAWMTLQQTQVGPNNLYQFNLPDRHVNYTNLNARGAYKIISDVPIIAYQFQPINGETSFTSDASLLLPVTVYDEYYYVIGWGESSFGNAQLNIVAAQDATTVQITPTVNTVAGGPIQAMVANQNYTLPVMNEADVIQIESSVAMLSGTFITSDKPIAVFSTHWCANVPNDGSCCCDHLEEQVYGLQTWGTSYVASRFPVRNNGTPEPSYWHLFAAEDNTKVHIDRHAEVTGIANNDFTMTKGQLMTMTVGGTVANPGDFVVTADKPIYLMQYMSSSFNTNVPAQQAGDPAMAQGVPVAQFRKNYVILVPSAWLYDRIVLTKKAGATIMLDGQPVAQNLFTKVGPADMPSEWEVARVPSEDGVHVLESDEDFGVVVIGYDQYDSYAYPGGLDQKQINPQ